MATIAEALAQAIHYHQEGNLPRAEQLYRQILQVDPAHPPALHFLGMLAHQLGQHEQALDYLRQAAALAPGEATFHDNLGLVFQNLGRLDEAGASYRQAVDLRPDFAEAHHHLGIVLRQQGRLEEAIARYRQALHFQPDFPDAQNSLGNALRDRGQLEDAIACYRAALRLRPDLPEFHYNLGNALADRGQEQDAAASYQRALPQRPDHPGAHDHLGISLRKPGPLAEASACFRRALRLRPDYWEAYRNLGNTLRAQGELDEALASYRQVVGLRPDAPEAYNQLGNALWEGGQRDEAIACYRQALHLDPGLPEVHYNLGNGLCAQGLRDEAIACYRQALSLRPDFPEAHHHLGTSLHERGRLDEAIVCYRQALRLRPDFPEVHNNLGNALRDQGQLDEAIASYRQALHLRPDLPEVHNNLGNIFRDRNRVEEASASYSEALRLRPDFAQAQANLGNALRDQGRLGEAIACYQRTLQLRPDDAELHSNLLYTLHFSPDYDAQAIAAAHHDWNQRHGEPLAAIPSHGNDRTPNRRLRVGYVSPDFREHVVGYNVWPLMSHHDPEQFDITLYASLRHADALTEQFRARAQNWCGIAGWPDDQVAARIRQDRIDILVDLTLHMGGNRLLVFARKPAPVQVTFAGYPGSTGLSAIDYRLTDPYLDPPGLHDALYAEESYRLPHSFWCYAPPTEEPAVGPLPARAGKAVTFGCLNHFCKVNDRVLELWAAVLRAVPGARLLLSAKEGSHRPRTLAFLAEQGVSGDRIEFTAPRPRPEYLALYHQLHIGLDTFPYNGHTTTLDSLWMGVPVITLVGETVVGRAGLSQLTNLGLEELAARAPEEFVRLAVDLANDLPRLQALRAGLRGRMKQSPLMDQVGFARAIEEAYRVMWRAWCARGLIH